MFIKKMSVQRIVVLFSVCVGSHYYLLYAAQADQLVPTPEAQSTNVAPEALGSEPVEQTPSAAVPVSVVESVPSADPDEPQEDPEVSDFTDEDVIDTTQARETSGNWVFKNYWWRKIEEEISTIKDIFEKVMGTQRDFFVKRSNLDKDLDVFYLKIGFEQGPLENIIKFCLDTIEKEKNKKNLILNKKEADLFEKIKEKQRDLEQLKEDTKSIQELDHKVDAALEILLSQIDVCNKYQQAAWDIFKKVSHELNDKIARKQYYVVKGLAENAQHVLEYISGPFSLYFEQLEEATKKHMGDIESKIEELSKAELDLRKETEILEKDEEAAEDAAAKAKLVVQKQKESAMKKDDAHKKTSAMVAQTAPADMATQDKKTSLLDTMMYWFTSVGTVIKDSCASAWNWSCSFWSSIESKIVHKKTSEKSLEKKLSEEQWPVLEK